MTVTIYEVLAKSLIKWKKKYHTVGTVVKSNRKIVERGKIDNSNTSHGSSLSLLGTDTSIDSDRVKLVLIGSKPPL